MIPFHIRFIQEILVEKSECLGLFTVSQFIKLSQSSKRAYKLIIKHKLIKKLVRFGCLDENLRRNFWRKLSPADDMKDTMKDRFLTSENLYD
jgi:hypothetical protein